MHRPQVMQRFQISVASNLAISDQATHILVSANQSSRHTQMPKPHERLQPPST